jgi:hypothetical protein
MILWWCLLGLAGVRALLGLIIRRSAESLLDELDDESWKQRIAPGRRTATRDRGNVEYGASTQEEALDE